VNETDDSQDWPLRDFSDRLRPPSQPVQQGDEEPEPAMPTQRIAVERDEAPDKPPELPPTSSSEVEVLYDEDDPPAAEVSEPAASEEPALRGPAVADEPPVVEEQPRAEELPAAEEPPAEPEPELEEQPSGLEAEAAPAEKESPEPAAAAPAAPVEAALVEEGPVEEVPAEEVAPEAPHVAGDLDIPDGYSVLEGTPNGQRRTVAIVISRFNGEITNRLLESALGALDEAGVSRDAVLVMPVPGAFELPIAAMALAKTRRYSCVVALGCVIRGETPHFDFVAGEAASGLQLAGIETGVPVSLGLLTCDTAEQAEARVERGAWAARTALEMADAFAQLRTAVARG